MRIGSLTLLLCIAFSVSAWPVVPATPGTNDSYVSGGTAVAKAAGNNDTFADEGGVVCVKGNAPASSAGGGCVDFAQSILVQDASMGTQVAFQVCYDNDGNGRCFQDTSSTCGDDIFFSHDDAGNFFNPLGPLPTSFRAGCPGSSTWNGPVVFICDGVHVASPEHVHPATSGAIIPLSVAGSGYGDFCGGGLGKPYLVV